MGHKRGLMILEWILRLKIILWEVVIILVADMIEGIFVLQGI
jgi:hypothetical protein